MSSNSGPNSGDSNDPSTVVNGIITSYEAKLGAVAPSAVIAQVALMAALSFTTLVAFSLLRPKNRVVYAPKSKYSIDSKKPPVIKDGLLDWLPPLLKTKEPELIDKIGLDAVTFLRFLKMCRYMFTFIALASCGILVPVDVIYHNQNTIKGSNWLRSVSIQDVRGNSIYAHVAVTYVITAIVFFFVWTNYRTMVILRWQWFRSADYQNSLHARSLITVQVPKSLQSDQGLNQLLNQLQIPYPTTAVHIGRPVGKLPELIEAHNESVKVLEQILTTYLKNPEKIPAKRPAIRIGGFWGIGGKKVDAIDFYTRKIQVEAQRVEVARERIEKKKAENYGFESFAAVPYAHIVAQKLDGKTLKGARFEMAPHPHDIIWENLPKSDGQRRTSNFVGWLFLVMFLILYTIPLIAVSFLANLAGVTQYVDFLDSWQSNSNLTFSIFVGVVPPALAVLLQLALPPIIRWIAKGQGAITHSKLDRSVLGRYTGFLIISQFFIFSLLSVFFNLISEVVADIGKHESFDEIIKGFKKVPRSVQTTWVQQSSYWLTWFPLRGFSAFFDLAQVVSLLWIGLRTRLFGRTPRDIREWTKPPEFDYPVYFSNMIFMVAVGFIYAPLAPLIAVLAAFAFFASSFLYKYQLMYIYVTKIESGGRLWKLVVNRILVCLLFMDLLMILTVGLQEGWIHAIVAAPPAFGVLVFKLFLTRTYDFKFNWYIPNQEEIAGTVVHTSDARKNRLEKRFGHPSLTAELFTPQIHKKSEHLLAKVYHGRITETEKVVNGKTVDGAQIGGLTFAALNALDLEYDRGLYFKERGEDAWETSSITSTQVLGNTGGPNQNQNQTDYFQQKHAVYMQQGPSNTGNFGNPSSSFGQAPVELSAFNSEERLIDPNYQGPRSQTPYSHQSHGSMSSVDMTKSGMVGYVDRPNSRQGSYPQGPPSRPSSIQQQVYPPSYPGSNSNYPPSYGMQPHTRTGSTASFGSQQQLTNQWGLQGPQQAPPQGSRGPYQQHRQMTSQGSQDYSQGFGRR